MNHGKDLSPLSWVRNQVNLNELAQRISQKEGKKVSLTIAQIKEVLRCFGDVLLEREDDLEFLEICSKIYAAAKKREKK